MSEQPTTSICGRCGATFHCGRDDTEACWCTRLPSLAAAYYKPGSGCLCEACLRDMLESPAPAG